jgi:hypothetical protein
LEELTRIEFCQKSCEPFANLKIFQECMSHPILETFRLGGLRVYRMRSVSEEAWTPFFHSGKMAPLPHSQRSSAWSGASGRIRWTCGLVLRG